MLKSATTAAKPPSSLTQACRSQRARLWLLALDGTLCSLPPTSTPSLSDAPIEHFPIRSECLLLVSLRRLGDGTEDGAVSGRDLPRHQPEPGGEIAALGEHFAIADRRHHGARDDWPDARHRHQTLARRVFLRQARDVSGQAFDALVKPTPVACQILDNAHHALR